jgi:hypothetical protein
MASIFAAIHSGLSTPVVAAFHGDDVVRWPAGVEADAVTVEDSIWVPQNPQQDGQINPQDTFGGTLGIPEATTIAAGDLWIINSQTYRVKMTQEADPLTGMRDLELVRAERKVVRNVPGSITLRKGFS